MGGIDFKASLAELDEFRIWNYFPNASMFQANVTFAVMEGDLLLNRRVGASAMDRDSLHLVVDLVSPLEAFLFKFNRLSFLMAV